MAEQLTLPGLAAPARTLAVLPGIGPGRQRRLRELGIECVRHLAAADERLLIGALGPTVGPTLHRLARGADDTPLAPRRPPARSHGREHTYESDTTDPAAVRETAARLARAVAHDLRRRRTAERLTVTVRFAPFETRSHRIRLAEPANDAVLLEEATMRALDRFDLDRPVRLVGVQAALVAARARRRRSRRGPVGQQLPGIHR